MTDSGEHEALRAKQERNRQQRIAAIKDWVAYVDRTPPEEWGPQLNALVESQLDAARGADRSPEQYRRVERAGREWDRADACDSHEGQSDASDRH